MTGGGLVRCEGKDPDGNPFSISDRACDAAKMAELRTCTGGAS